MLNGPHRHTVKVSGREVLVALGSYEGENFGDEGGFTAACVAVEADRSGGTVLGVDDEVEDGLGLVFAAGD